MKKRLGFVSNSSSSSFIIFKQGLNSNQIEMIKNHSEIARKLMEQGTSLDLSYYENQWNITETDLTIEGYTWMDNFDMSTFLIDVVQVDRKFIRWTD